MSSHALKISSFLNKPFIRKPVPGNTMIKTSDIKKSYGETSVLRGLSLDIERGGIYGIAGRSGAGKSTLLRCINGLEDYDSGSLIVDGVDVKNLSLKDLRSFRKNIGMIFQHFSLLERLTVYENIALPLRCWKYKQSYIDKRVRELAEVIGIPDKINQKPRELSGGQKQRVAIGRALAMEPDILLCDEATSALDPRTAKTIISLLKEINSQLGITIVFVSHQMQIIKELCNDMAIIEHGRVAVAGSVDEVFSNQHAALTNLIGEDSFLTDDMTTIKVRLNGYDNGTIIPRMAVELGVDFIIRGNKDLTADNLNEYVISYSEKNKEEVIGYLLANDALIEKYDNDYREKGSIQRDAVYDPDIIMTQPETV